MLSQAIKELENGLLKLNNISYDSIDSLMRKIMKSHNVTAEELHNEFKTKYKKTPDDWIKEKMKNLKEDHKEIASGKKSDDEGYIARSELDSIEKAIKNLRKSIKSGNQQLPAWVQSKITKAADYIDTAAEYLESDEKIEESQYPSFKINKDTHKKQKTKNIITKKLDDPKQLQEQKVATNIAKKLGGTGARWQKPKLKEEISLVEKILGEEKCGKGMYWCKSDKKCKPIPISEEKDPKGPTKAYKTPEEIAKKHGVSLDHIKKQLKMGTKVEFEHTTSENEARITALQHLEELPDYYTKLKKMETQKESSIVRDANENYYAEFIDIIKAGTIEEENPCWKGYTQVGMKMKNGREVPNCVPSEGVPKAKGYKKKKKNVNEAARMPAQTGNNIFVTLSWRGKYYTIQIFFPQAKVPSRLEISDEIQKIYPGSRVVTYRVSDLKPGEPLIYAYKGGNGGKLGPNKNYVKPMGEGVEITEAKK